MKKVFFGFLVCLVVICVLAWTPTDRMFNLNQFGTNNFSISVKSGAAMTNTIFRPASPGAGAFGTPNFKFTEDNDVFTFQDNGPTPIWNFDNTASGTFTVFFPIHGDGSGLTNLPSNSGILTASGTGTNTTLFTTDNNPTPTGSALILRPMEKSTNPGLAAKYIEIQPPYTNSTEGFEAKYRTVVSVATNTLGDLRPNIVLTEGYNFSGNFSGVSDYGNTSTNEPSWASGRETRHQNFGSISQLEWHETLATPFTDFQTNYSLRWLGAELAWETTNRSFSSSSGSINLGQFDLKNPRGSGLFGVRWAASSALSRSIDQTLNGVLTTKTNDVGFGGVDIQGGTFIIGPPSGTVTAKYNWKSDWDNGLGLRPHTALYLNADHASEFMFGKAGGSPTNWNFYTNVQGSAFSSDGLKYTKMPTNTPTDGFVLTAAGTAGYTKWAAGGSGSGDTNAISYLPDMINAARVRNLANGTPVFELNYTNGVQALGITNSGSDTDGFAINGSSGGNRFRFVEDGDMTINSPNAFYLHVNENLLTLDFENGIRKAYDADGDLAIDWSEADDIQMNTLVPATVNATAVNLLEGGSIALDPALSADGTYSGSVTRTGTAGATLAFGDLVVLDVTDSRWELADANSASGADGDSRGMIGVCILAAAADGDPTNILLQGVVRADAAFPSFTVNAPIYVSETAGDITATSPTTSGNVVRILGAATTADEIYFDPDRVWTVYVP